MNSRGRISDRPTRKLKRPAFGTDPVRHAFGTSHGADAFRAPSTDYESALPISRRLLLHPSLHCPSPTRASSEDALCRRLSRLRGTPCIHLAGSRVAKEYVEESILGGKRVYSGGGRRPACPGRLGCGLPCIARAELPHPLSRSLRGPRYLISAASLSLLRSLPKFRRGGSFLSAAHFDVRAKSLAGRFGNPLITATTRDAK